MAIIRLQGAQEKASGIYFEVDSTSTPIGEGGMGKVYKGTSVDTKSGVKREVAIKFLFMDLPEQAVERARREASIRLRNDNLVEMLGFIETDEERDGKTVKHYHVVSELLDGVSLADILQGKCTNPGGKEIPYARQLMNDFQKAPDHFAKTVIKATLSGLMALHDAGYIHRDIDPSNIFITADGHIKLIDFGISKQMKNLTTNDKALTVAGAFMGKPEYASPELALGDLKHQNHTTDIYAVGVLLYQCITGNVPFEGTRFDVLDKQVREKLPLKDIANKELKRIITKATEKRQELRYQTAAEMRVDLESMDVKRAADPKKKKLVGMFLGIGLLIVVLGIVAFTILHKNSSAEKASLMEKNYTDSLTNLVNNNVRDADSLINIGAMHEEGFDKTLLKAKQLFAQASEAAMILNGKGIDTPDFSSSETRLDDLLGEAQKELAEKADMLESIGDPELAAEASGVRQRAEDIKAVLNSKEDNAPAAD